MQTSIWDRFTDADGQKSVEGDVISEIYYEFKRITKKVDSPMQPILTWNY